MLIVMELCAFYCSEHILTALILRTTLQGTSHLLQQRKQAGKSWLAQGLMASSRSQGIRIWTRVRAPKTLLLFLFLLLFVASFLPC